MVARPAAARRLRVTLVPAVDRAARVLQVLAAGERRLTEVARAQRLPKSTALAILRTLHHHRFVSLDTRTGRYRLGPALVALGGAAQARADLREAARPQLERLAQATEETAILHVPEGEGYLILDRQESPHQLRVAAPVGFRLPPLAGAVAKAVLAWLPPAETARRLARRRLPQFTPRSITNRAAYVRALGAVRRDGFAVDDEEYLPGVRAVSAPVIDDEGHVVATLSVVGVKDRLSETMLRSAARLVLRAARDLSSALAWGAAADAAGGTRRA